MSVIYDKILGKLRDGKSSGGGGGGGGGGAVTSVNGKTGDVVVMPSDGMPIEVLTSSAISGPGKIYTKTLTDDTTFTFFTPISGSPNSFRLVITQPSTPVAVVFPAGIWWGIKNNFASDNPAPTMSTGDVAYGFTFEYDGTRFLGNLSYIIRLS